MDYLNLGKVIGTHGLDGTLTIASTTDFSMERYQPNQTIYLENPHNQEVTTLHVVSHRNFKATDYVKFEEINTMEDGQKYKGYFVLINKDEAPIPEGYYRFSDLVGCKIVDENKKELGIVIKVEEFPAQITLRAKTSKNQQFFVPFIENEFILDVNIETKTIKIKYMEGML